LLDKKKSLGPKTGNSAIIINIKKILIENRRMLWVILRKEKKRL